MTLQDFLNGLQKVERRGTGFMARCPIHEDKTPSLSVCEVNGRILVNCFAGCATEEVIGAMGLKMSDLFTGNEKNALAGANDKGGEIVATYDYTDENGNLLFQPKLPTVL